VTVTESDGRSDTSMNHEDTGRMVTIFWRLVSILGILLLLGFLIAPHFCQASEDAIILYQYSANLAHTGVISFIPHGPRAEGATDFLWMIYLAAGRFLGIPSYGLAIVTSAACILLLAVLLVKLARQQTNFWNISAVVGLLLLAPQSFAAEAGFSVFAFALFLGLMATAAFMEFYGWATIAGLLLCLVRPDGVVFALPLLAVYLYRGEGTQSRMRKLERGFLLPGFIYFIWRWHYFKHLLPLPFYVKSDTARVAGFLVVQSAISLAPPLAAACILAYVALRKDLFLRRNLVFFTTLLVPSSMFYMAMRLDQNYANRFFFYPLIIVAVLIAGNYQIVRKRALQVLLAGFAIWAVFLAYFWINWAVIYTLEYPQPRVVAVARELEQIPGRGTMIVTESGAIPFYSQWAAYDPWGLNTPEFATRLIRPGDVADLDPDLVIVHQVDEPLPCIAQVDGSQYTKRSWQHMTQNVIAATNDGEYTQWLLPQYNDYYRSHPQRWNGKIRPGKYDAQCWFVRNSYAHAADVTSILKHHGAIAAADLGTPDVPPK